MAAFQVFTEAYVWAVKKVTTKKQRWSHSRGPRRPRRIFFSSSQHESSRVQIDPWRVRDDFLTLETEADFLRFLNQVGLFFHGYSDDWEEADFKGLQQVFRELLVRSPERWDSYFHKLRQETPEFNIPLILDTIEIQSKVGFLLRFSWQGAPHSAVIRAIGIVQAILTTIHIDHLRGARFGFCARPDCQRPFEIISKHKRKFCKQYCAHLESLRRMRKSQRRAQRGTG